MECMLHAAFTRTHMPQPDQSNFNPAEHPCGHGVQLDIEEKVRLARDTEAKISAAREVYRPVASRGSLLYFLIDNLDTLDRVYHYSMANFVFILRKGMSVTPGGADEGRVPEAQRLGEAVPLEQRVKLLIDTTSYEVFQYVAQGLFERHKLIVAAQLCVLILRKDGRLQGQKLDFLLKGPRAQARPLRLLCAAMHCKTSCIPSVCVC